MIELQKKQFRTLNKWFRSPLGLYVAHEFLIHLELEKDYLWGDTLVQLGACGDNLWLQKFNYKTKLILSPYPLAHKIHLQSALNHLPLDRNSVDCVIAPLTFEPFGTNLNLLDEIDRVLKPMGFILLLGINPWSVWGGALKLGLLGCYAHQKIKMRSSFSINRMFIHRGYRQYSLNNLCYMPPINNNSLIKKMTLLDEIGKMLWPFPSGFYCYIAQKYQLIQPSLRELTVKQPLKKYQPPLQPVVSSPLKLGSKPKV